MSRVLVLLVVSCSLGLATPAEALGDRPTVSVDALAHSDDGFTPEQQRVISAFRDAIQRQGLDEAGPRRISLFVDAIDAGDEGATRLVVSVTVLEELPDTVVDIAADAEAFYASTSLAREDLPVEGADVRRAMSAEWIRDYRVIEDHSLFVIAESELDAKAAAIVAAL